MTELPEKPSALFDDHYPDGCPPDQAVSPKDDVYFRLVETDPPTSVDFRSHYERQARGGETCEGRGLSIYSDQADAIKLYQRFAKKYGVASTKIGRFVAQIKLIEDSGKVMNTPSSFSGSNHFTWWACKDFNRFSAFDRIVEDGADGLA